jgi:hypothetical protein
MFMIKIILCSTLLLFAAATAGAHIGQDLRDLKGILAKESIPEITDSGIFLKQMKWRGRPGNTNLPFSQALGMNLWQIEATAYVNLDKNLWTIIKINYRKLVGGPIGEAEQNQIVFHNSPPQQLVNIAEPEITPKHRPEYIVIQYNHIDDLLEQKEAQMVEFENNWRCIGSNLDTIKQKLGNPAKVENDIHHFTHLDNKKNVSWKVHVKLWQGPNDIENIAHRVVYKRITKFTPEEQSWLMLTNSNRGKWGVSVQNINKVNQFISTPGAVGPLRAWVKPEQQEVGIETEELAEAKL